MAVRFRPVQTHETAWLPSSLRVSLNCRLDARLVPSASSPEGVRLGYSYLAVLDDFLGEDERASLLSQLTAPHHDHACGPPQDKWERNTADGAQAARTWGLRGEVLHQMAANPSQAMVEVHSRLARLYPDYIVAHMPAEYIQEAHDGSPESNTGAPPAGHLLDRSEKHQSDKPEFDAAPSSIDGKGQRGFSDAADSSCRGRKRQQLEQAPSPADQCAGSPVEQENINGHQHATSTKEAENAMQAEVDCATLLANAPVYGDIYSWHVDADPLTFPDSPFRADFGDYANGEPGLPLFMSLLLYLDEAWPRDWDGETLFLDGETDVGILVRPKRYRAVLMDQDVLHRVTTPSQLAGSRPRYSLVWKLVFLPRQPGHACCISRPEWGAPTNIGSAARLENVKRALLRRERT